MMRPRNGGPARTPWIAVAVVLAALAHTGTARANDADVRKAMERFVKAVGDGTSAAFLDQCQLAILPAADRVVTAPRALSVGELIGTPAGPVTWKVRIVHAHANRAYGVGFAVADVDALDAHKKVIRSLRASAMIVGPESKQPHVIVTEWGVPLADDKAQARATSGGEPAVKPLGDKVVQDSYEHDAHDYAAALGKLDTKTLAEWMHSDDAVLIGSAREVVHGGDAGAKTIAGWKLELSPAGGVMFGAPPGDGGAFWLATNVRARTRTRGHEVTITYRALFLWSIEVMGEGGVVYKDLALAHFSSPS